MSHKKQERSVESSGSNSQGNHGAYYYNNSGSSHHNHYLNDAKRTEYCTGNGGQKSGFKWSRTDGGEKNVKYDNRK